MARSALLSARPPESIYNRGRLIGSGSGVGEQRIVNSIIDEPCTSMKRIGQQLQAGTNCGNSGCEIHRILHQARALSEQSRSKKRQLAAVA